MPTNPLKTLMRLRQAELDEASRAVGEALEAETQAGLARKAAEQAILDETRIAASSGADSDVERFAAWLKRGRAQLRATEQRLEDATMLTAARRAELSLVRASAKATQDALDRSQLEERHRQERVAQREQDEIGQRRR